MIINPSGFREYDARWIFEKDIDLEGVENLGKGFKDLKADTYESGDMTALDSLVTVIESDSRLLAAGQDVISDYLKYQDTFDKAQAKAADEAAEELAARLKATAQDELPTITDVMRLF